MKNFSRILLVVVIITFLFAGVIAAETKKLDVKDGVENGEAGIYYEKSNQEHEFHVEDVTNIPEFPKVALPIAAMIGLVFLFQQRKKED